MGKGKLPSLFDFWAGFRPRGQNCLHPEDERFLRTAQGKKYEKNFEDDKRVQLTSAKLLRWMYPQPYAGDLNKAKIIILQLNPGVAPSDYWNDESRGFRSVLRQNFRQQIGLNEFPFFWLNPAMSRYAGFVYWEQKLRGVAVEIARKKCGGDYLRALQLLARTIAVVELVPYHSNKFRAGTLAKCLPSARVAREWVFNLVQRQQTLAINRRKTILVLRHADVWDLREGPGVIVYPSVHALAASLGPNSTGGQAILKQLGIISLSPD